PDAAIAHGEVGKVGVSIASIEDMQDLFEGIPLDRVSTSMTINATASILLALYIAVARRQGVAPATLAGTVQNDILKEYIARGAAAVGAHHARPVRREGPVGASAALPRADRGQHAHRAAAREQRGARDRAGARRGPRRVPVAAHELEGRGAGAPDRGVGASRA